jgi:hypothetical protein
MTLPRVAAGGTCPTSRSKPVPGIAAVLGDGPIYPWGTGIIPLNQFVADAKGQYWIKVVWLIDDERYQGAAMVRGQRLDDGTPLLFSQTTDGRPADELRLFGASHQSGGSGWKEYGSYIVLSDPGCYGYQVDGVGTQETLIFEVH